MHLDGERRNKIYDEFWSKDISLRREFINQRVVFKKKERSRSRNKTKERNVTRIYSFLSNDGIPIEVCAKFFQSTLGYKKDHFIESARQNVVKKSYEDRRGSHEPAHKLSATVIKAVKDHINSFHPAVSHYRRAHAPLRRYLPPHFNVTIMYESFQEKRPDIPLSYQTYRRIFNTENIGFTKLGEEECEVCETHKQHECNKTEQVNDANKRTLDSDKNRFIYSENFDD